MDALASGQSRYDLPPEPAGWSVFHDHDQVVVHAGGGDDVVRVESRDADAAGIAAAWRVVINGRVLRFPAGTRLTIRAGGGDDHVTVTGPAAVTVLGGVGNDVIIGGGGEDRLYGGPGHDILSGTRGDDVMHTGERYYHATLAEYDLTIDIKGGDEFIARVRSDLDTLRASPTGGQILAALDRTALRGVPLLIIEDETTSAAWTTLDRPHGRPFAVFSVCYNPTRGVTADHSPPIIGLFHELAHIYDLAHGTSAAGTHDDPDDPDLVRGNDGGPTGAPNDERTAVGLPVDHDGDPTTPPRIHPQRPYQLTRKRAPRRDGPTPT